LDRSLAHGLAWSGFAKGATQLVTWASTLFVARLLRPEDYGLFGMASIFFWAIQALGEFGLGNAVLKDRTLSHQAIAQINSVSALLGLASTALVCALAGPLSVFFAEPELFEIILAISPTFFFSSLKVVPATLLKRDLKFRTLAFTETIQATSTALAVLGFALLGLSYWSLALGTLIGTACGMAAYLIARFHPFAIPRTETVAETVRVGRELVVSRFAWYAMFNADFLVAGRVLGKAPLGNYTWAWTLASLPVAKISMLVTGVSLPYFAAVQERKESLRRYLLLMTEGLALVTFPASVGIGLLADQLVPLLFGPRWTGAILPLQVLALAVPLRSVATLLPQVTTVLGQTAFGMYHAVAGALVMAVAFVVGSRWGTLGIAGAWATVYPLVLLPLLLRVLRGLECSLGGYLRAVRTAAFGTVTMAGVVVLTRVGLSGALPLPAILAIELLAGMLTYAGALWIIDRERVLATFRFFRSVRQR
jgi:PST family polysaccharide transporter